METIKVGLGSDVKMNVNMTPIDGQTLESIEWSLDVESNSKSVTIAKEDAIKVDANNYIVVVSTAQIGAGVLKARLTASISDTDLGANQKRMEVTPPLETGIEVV